MTKRHPSESAKGSQAKDAADAMSITGLLTLPPDERGMVQWLLRQGEANTAEVTAHLAVSEAAALALLEALAAQGFVTREDSEEGIRWRVRFAPKRRRQVPANLLPT